MKTQMLVPSGHSRQAAVAHLATAQQPARESAVADNRPEAAVLRRLAETIHQSPRVVVQRNFSDNISNSPTMVAQRRKQRNLFGGAIQRKYREELRGKFASAEPVKRREEKPLRRKGAPEFAAPREPAAPRSNHTGLPDGLKSGVESFSGISLDNVKVHLNSSRPAQLNALAYTQGSDIHVAPGQEPHLPHEAWHVVQQAQGRVQPTLQMKDGVPVNDDEGLEHEADVMGEMAAAGIVHAMRQNTWMAASPAFGGLTIQRKLKVQGKRITILPDWLERGQHPAIVRILSNWIEGQLGFAFGSWSEAISRAEMILSVTPDNRPEEQRSMLDRVRAEPELNEAQILNLVHARFSGRISAIPRMIVVGQSGNERAKFFSDLLAGVQLDIQTYLTEVAPGFVSLVRFFVDDRDAGKKHPGLNSWAYLRLRQGLEQTTAGTGSRSEVASSHMLYGHDVQEEASASGRPVMSGSPMVSTSESVGHLLEADSPYNPARSTALAELSDAKDRMGGGKLDLRRGVLKKERMAEGQQEGQYVSDRIIALTHGHANEVIAEKFPKVGVATHLAFLVLPEHRLNRIPPSASDKSCCVLEREVTIFAPDQDVARWVVGTVNNRLPELTGRVTGEAGRRFPGTGQRLGDH
jgi:hypothetical protein